MISKKMTDALNSQINAELRSAYLYLAMALRADSVALKGISNWFFVQWREEQDHSRIFQNYVINQNQEVELKPIPVPKGDWKSPLEMFMEALEHEKEITRLVGELVTLANKEKDYATLERLQWFVREQVEEESSVQEQVEAFSRISSNPEFLIFLDDKLKKRQYTPAEPLEDQ